MKRIIKFLVLTVALSLFLSACSSQRPRGPALDQRQALTLAQKHTRMMTGGEYDTLTEEFRPQIKEQLDSRTLSRAWQQMTQAVGRYQSLHSMEYSDKDGMAVVLVKLKCDNGGVALTLSYDADGKLTGLWLYTAQLEEYQPQSTNSYTETEITVGDIGLKGILTTPKGTDSYPVAVLVQGSGQSDFNGTIGPNRPFMEIAHRLAEKGIASVRINKRFFQFQDMAAEEKLTIYNEYMDDIYARIDWAKENVSEDIYVIGHSQGGMSAAKIALDNDVKGVVMMAGSIRGLEDIIYDQNMAALEKMTDISRRDERRMTQQIQDAVQQVKALTADGGESILGVPASYWFSLKDLNRADILKNQLDIPVLIMQGTADFQVYYDKDYQYMQQELSGRDNIIFKEYEGLNHLFMPQALPGVTDTSEYMSPNHIPSQVTDDIATFINGEK